MTGVPSEIFQCLPVRPVVTTAPASFYEAWQSETVQALLQGIIAEQALDRLPILADALEEAGCHDELLLRHCRECPEHYEFCWVLTEGLPKARFDESEDQSLAVNAIEENRLPIFSQGTESSSESQSNSWMMMFFLLMVALNGFRTLLTLTPSSGNEKKVPVEPVIFAPADLTHSGRSSGVKKDLLLTIKQFQEKEPKADTDYSQAKQEMLRKALQQSEKKP